MRRRSETTISGITWRQHRPISGAATLLGAAFRALGVLHVLLLLLLLAPAAALAQNAESSTPAPLRSQPADPEQKPPALGSPEEEMRARNSIKLDEQNHRDNLERVHEATRLAFSLRESYEQRQSFNREDLKRLERLEKLVRKVRSEAGGEDAAEELDKYPNGVGETLTLLARMTDELCDQVEKTPRQVISASIVVCANEIIQVVKQLRKQVAQ